MSVTVKIDIKRAQIKTKLEKAWDKGLRPLSEQVLKDCNNYAKQDTGAMIASSQTASDLSKGLIKWEGPYAARQHWEIKTASHDVNPNATWRWTLKAKEACLKIWNKIAQKEMDQNI